MAPDEPETDPRSDPVWRFAFVLDTILVGLFVAACAFVMVGLLGQTANCSDCQTGATSAGLAALLLLLAGLVAGIALAYRTSHFRWLLLPLAVVPVAFVAEVVVYELLT